MSETTPVKAECEPPEYGRPHREGDEIPAGWIFSNTPEGGRIFQSKEERRMYYRKASEFSVPEPYKSYKQALLKAYNSSTHAHERLAALEAEVCRLLAASANAFDMFVHFLKYPALSDERSVLRVLETAAKWFARHDLAKLRDEHLTPQLKRTALDCTVRCKFTQALPLYFRVCAIVTEAGVPADIATYASRVIERDCIEKSMFMEAFTLADALGWLDRYDLKAIVIPLVLTQRMTAEELLRDRKRAQEKYVAWLDALIPLDGYELAREFEPYKSINKCPLDLFRDKTLEKTIGKLLRKFELSDFLVPNLRRSRMRKELCYYLHAFLETAGASFGECNDEFDKLFAKLWLVAKCNTHLCHYVILTLCNKNQREAGMWWALFNDVSHDRLPRELKHLQLHEPRAYRTIQHKVQLYRDRLKSNAFCEVPTCLHDGYNIVLVDSIAKFDDLIGILPTEKVIGIDTEWQQSVFKDILALVQIACESAVYIVDLVILQKQPVTEPQWISFFEALLTGPAIKLGFDFGNDLRQMFTTFKFVDVKDKMQNIVDLKLLTCDILNENEDVLDLSDPQRPHAIQKFRTTSGTEVVERHFSLAFLYKKVTDNELDKSHQESSWATRPLRPQQVMYAAKDAFALCEIYYGLQRLCEEKDVHFEACVKKCDPTNAQPRHRRERQIIEEQAEIPALIADCEKLEQKLGVEFATNYEAKFIADCMCAEIGRYLRRMGFDVVISLSSKSETLAIAKADVDRWVLTTGKQYTAHSNVHWLCERLINVPSASAKPAREQALVVLGKVKAKPLATCAFQRCAQCNSLDFIRAPAPYLHFLFVMSGIKDARKVFYVPDDESQCSFEYWKPKLRAVKPESYGLRRATALVDVQHVQDVVFECDGGIIIAGNIAVRHENDFDSHSLLIQKYSHDVYEVEGRVFHICGSCGMLYFNGCYSLSTAKPDANPLDDFQDDEEDEEE